MIRPYTKAQSMSVQAGTKEADELLKKAWKRKSTPRTNKYGNKPQEYNGRTYDSITEADFARELDMRKLAKDIKDWTPQFVLKLSVNGELVRRYTIDFCVEHNDGRMELIEVKGAATRDWLLSWRLSKSLLPAGQIPGVPKDAWLTLVKKQGKKFVHHRQALNYSED